MTDQQEIVDGPMGLSEDGIRFGPHAQGNEPKIDKLFRACIEFGASDLHLEHGACDRASDLPNRDRFRVNVFR